MTIFTKPTDDNKENEQNFKKAAILGIDTDSGEERVPPWRSSIAWSDREDHEGWGVWHVQLMRRRRVLTSICLGLLLLWLLMAAFVAGILFYRHLQKPTFYGWCGTKYVEHGRSERLEQRLEIDEVDEYERIEVPKFGANRPAIFIHDFRANVTAIVDVLADRCYVKPLDRVHVAPPKNFIDLVQKLKSGYYDQNPRTIRETYRVGEKVEKVSDLGSNRVYLECAHRDTFLLRKASHALERPLLPHSRHARQTTPQVIKFSAMDGDTVEVNEVLL